MARRRLAIGFAVLLVAAAAGYAAARILAPERLRQDLELRLARALDAEVEIRALHLSLGWNLHLDGRGVEVRDSRGRQLRAARVRAAVRPLAGLTGQRRLASLQISGARLEMGPPAPRPREDISEAEAAVRALVALEGRIRELVDRSLVADRVEVQGAEIHVVGDDGGGFRLLGFRGRLDTPRLRSGARFELRARVYDASGERGALEAEGDLASDQALTLSVAAADLELAVITPLLRALRPEARLGARLSGVVELASREPGQPRFTLDALAHGLESQGSLGAVLHSDRSAVRGSLELKPGTVRVELELAGEAVGAEVDATLERPLRMESQAEIAVAVHRANLADVRHAIGWLPSVTREEAERVVEPLEAGRLRLLRVGGAASVERWRTFLAGRGQEAPEGFVVDAQLEDAALRVGPKDRIGALQGRLWWTGDRVELHGATAELNGSALPRVELTIQGVSKLFALPRHARQIEPGAEPLDGLRALWLALRGDPGEPTSMPAITLQIERLHHPMLLWPLARTQARLLPLEGGMSILASGGSWAGVPFEANALWLFEPDEQIQAHVTVLSGEAAPPERGPRESWAHGRFELGAIPEGRWRQSRAGGRFRASGADLRLSDLDVELLPRGRAHGEIRLALGERDRVPVGADLAVAQSDVASLAGVFALPQDVASGTLDAAGSIRCVLGPEVSTADTLEGTLNLEAHDGTIQRSLPPVVALALASDLLTPLSRRDRIRYEELGATFAFREGRVRSDDFTLDGPDVRAFLSGDVDFARSPHPVDAEIALFLFRPVDALLDQIPLVNALLLGRNRNLVAAHFELDGPWEKPEVSMVPLRSLASGPGSLVFETLPALLRRGIEAIGDLAQPAPRSRRHAPVPPAAAAPAES